MSENLSNSSGYKSQEEFTTSHGNQILRSSPNWRDVPRLNENKRQRIHEKVLNVIPGVLANGARRRCATVKTMGSQYVRYRRAGCTPTQSHREAIKRAGEKHDIRDSAVYEHIRALPIEGPKEIIPHLEEINEMHYSTLPRAVRVFKQPCDRLLRVLSVIAEIGKVPDISPTDLTLQDVYRDQPGERNRILTADHDVVGLPRSDDEGRGASVHEAEVAFNRKDLKKISDAEPVYLTADARISTRDISLYDTDYSQVLQKIFEAIQTEMNLWGKQKPGPTISKRGDDNAAVRARIPYPDFVDTSGSTFARLEVQYWESGTSNVKISTNPLGRPYEEKDPCLSGPIDQISKPGIHILVGRTIDIIENVETPYCKKCGK